MSTDSHIIIFSDTLTSLLTNAEHCGVWRDNEIKYYIPEGTTFPITDFNVIKNIFIELGFSTLVATQGSSISITNSSNHYTLVVSGGSLEIQQTKVKFCKIKFKNNTDTKIIELNTMNPVGSIILDADSYGFDEANLLLNPTSLFLTDNDLYFINLGTGKDSVVKAKGEHLSPINKDICFSDQNDSLDPYCVYGTPNYQINGKNVRSVGLIDDTDGSNRYGGLPVLLANQTTNVHNPDRFYYNADYLPRLIYLTGYQNHEGVGFKKYTISGTQVTITFQDNTTKIYNIDPDNEKLICYSRETPELKDRKNRSNNYYGNGGAYYYEDDEWGHYSQAHYYEYILDPQFFTGLSYDNDYTGTKYMRLVGAVVNDKNTTTTIPFNLNVSENYIGISVKERDFQNNGGISPSVQERQLYDSVIKKNVSPGNKIEFERQGQPVKTVRKFSGGSGSNEYIDQGNIGVGAVTKNLEPAPTKYQFNFNLIFDFLIGEDQELPNFTFTNEIVDAVDPNNGGVDGKYRKTCLPERPGRVGEGIGTAPTYYDETNFFKDTNVYTDYLIYGKFNLVTTNMSSKNHLVNTFFCDIDLKYLDYEEDDYSPSLLEFLTPSHKKTINDSNGNLDHTVTFLTSEGYPPAYEYFDNKHSIGYKIKEDVSGGRCHYQQVIHGRGDTGYIGPEDNIGNIEPGKSLDGLNHGNGMSYITAAYTYFEWENGEPSERAAQRFDRVTVCLGASDYRNLYHQGAIKNEGLDSSNAVTGLVIGSKNGYLKEYE